MAEEHTIHRVVEQHIQKHTPWDALPSSVRQLGQTREQYHKAVVQYALKHQWRWRDSLVQKVLPDEREYYEELLKMSSKHLMLYPYHLADVLVKGLRVTPFKYYWDMMFSIMSEDMSIALAVLYPHSYNPLERSYDALPNFTAADGVRLLGIGRNQYIDIMNRCRNKSWSQFFNKKENTIRQLLPTEPVDIEIEYWWIVSVGFVSEDDARSVSPLERSIVDELIEHGPLPAGHFRRRALHSLYKRGLVYLSVPIDNNDQIIVPPLEGFVMNRVLGDYFENLLYKIFVSIDERTTIHELATLLQVDAQMVKLAVSLYIRLGFAKKKNVLPLAKLAAKSRKGVWNKTWYKSVSFSGVVEASDHTVSPMKGRMPGDKIPESRSPDMSSTTSADERSTAVSSALEMLDAPKEGKRIGLVLDATITAFLMMGNLAPGLKSHAVTLFEVGKLADEALPSFLSELDTVDDLKDHQAEGEAERYFSHAVTLRETIRFLRKADRDITDWDGGIDLLRCERLESLDQSTRTRILNKNYALLVSMAPISNETPTITSCVPRHFGAPIAEVNSGWFTMFVQHIMKSGVPSIMLPRGYRLRSLPPLLQVYLMRLQRGEQFIVSQWGHDSMRVSATSILAVLSDALLASPVLVQLYSTNVPEPQTACVPFPAPPESNGVLTPLQVELNNRPEMSRLREELDMECSFGYVKFVSLEDANGESQWKPLSVVYGMPLFDAELNKQVCSGIEHNSVFSCESIEKHSMSMRRLSVRFFDFIALHRGHDMEFRADQLPLPGHVLTFDGTALCDAFV